MLQKILLTIFLFSFVNLFGSNQSSLVIKSEDSSAFILFLNDIQQNSEPLSLLEIKDLSFEIYAARIVLIPDSQQTATILKLKPGHINYYVIRWEKDSLLSLQLIDYIPFKDTTSNLDSIETILSDSLKEPKSNKVSCDFAMQERIFEAHLKDTKNLLFESEKLAYWITEIENNCLLVKQLQEVLTQFAFEVNKIKIAKKSYLKLVDPENWGSIYGLFDYSQSKDELKDFSNEQ